MENLNPTQLNVSLEKTSPIVCEGCGNETFTKAWQALAWAWHVPARTWLTQVAAYAKHGQAQRGLLHAPLMWSSTGGMVQAKEPAHIRRASEFVMAGKACLGYRNKSTALLAVRHRCALRILWARLVCLLPLVGTR